MTSVCCQLGRLPKMATTRLKTAPPTPIGVTSQTVCPHLFTDCGSNMKVTAADLQLHWFCASWWRRCRAVYRINSLINIIIVLGDYQLINGLGDAYDPTSKTLNSPFKIVFQSGIITSVYVLWTETLLFNPPLVLLHSSWRTFLYFNRWLCSLTRIQRN